MGVRERIQTLRKVFGNTEPPAIRAGEEAAGMTPTNPFSPGEPIGPYDGFSRTPRTQNFVTGYNIAARPRSHERVAFETLKGLIDAYDVASMCIWHRIDSIRSLEWSLVASKGYGGDITDAIPVGMAALSKPDRSLPFENWLAAWLFDILAYDAGALSRMRNLAGRAVGLRVVDGTTIAPLLDYWGNTPQAPAEAYVQYVNGLPWNWLTTDDLIYVPFRKVSSSPYGKAPLESILLNANTDLRFQAYFLQRFTEGNIPAAFAAAPETWTPQQIEQFQEYWDAFILGDQAVKSQIKWIPGGSRIEFANEHDFSDHFSLFLMRKTAAAYHVVPADLGFTENVNRSSGESQADVQHRVGDLPLIRHVQRILSSFLQDDLGLPLSFAFDLGEEQADRLQQAQADKIYVELGAISASDVREMRYGLPEPEGIPVPRFIFDARSGPIPLANLYALAGEIDPASGAPKPGTQLPTTVFAGVEGVAPVPPIKAVPLAEQEFGPGAMPPAPPPQPAAPTPGEVAKDGEPTAGITSGTGIVSYDLVRQDEDDKEGDGEQQVAKARAAEIAAFRRYVRETRRKGRAWRPFDFTAVGAVQAHRLNNDGSLTVRKSAGQVAVAGLAVRAADTGRILMLQRAMADDDPAAGTWEAPGGHLEDDETPLEAAKREWSEETGCALPDGEVTGEWVGGTGIYRGFVWTIATEDAVPVFDGRDTVTNPDDPDADRVEALAWWDPNQLPGNPAVRPELLDSLDDVLAALCETVAKAGAGPGPKVGDPAAHWPGWDHDERAAAYWSPILAGALAGVLTASGARLIAARFLAARPEEDPDADRRTLISAAIAYLAMQQLDLAGPIADRLAGIYIDGVLIGGASAEAVLNGGKPDLGGWTPGDTDTAEALIAERGQSAALDTLLDGADGTAAGIAESRIGDMGRALADATLNGATEAEAGQAIQDALFTASAADAVAITEITNASGAGAMQVYQQSGVTHGRWITERDRKVCPRCQANEAAGPIQIGQPFPSGDVQPPAHTRCRCALVTG